MRGLLWLLLAVQAGGVLVIAAALHFWLGAGALAALMIGLACALLVRLAISVNNFAMSARHGSPTPAAFALGPLGRLRLFWREFAASMMAASWHMPRSRAATRIYPDAQGLPVLLLHGYGANSGFWAQLAARLDAARISHATLDLQPLGCGIDDYLPMVEEAARALCWASGSHKLVVVGHSMGGLVARAWLRRDRGAMIARLITLGTPHHGTRLAGLALGANGQQMRRGAGDRPESAWLRELAAGEDDATRALITSIWSHHDNIVAPQTSSLLPGARNIEFGGVGHVALGSDPGVLAAVMHEIAEASGWAA
ncbi:esterase/lipase family protein [Massilia terrae]|nr:alpha/beta fold hydrolase [Massilia terrae]